MHEDKQNISNLVSIINEALLPVEKEILNKGLKIYGLSLSNFFIEILNDDNFSGDILGITKSKFYAKRIELIKDLSEEGCQDFINFDKLFLQIFFIFFLHFKNKNKKTALEYAEILIKGFNEIKGRFLETMPDLENQIINIKQEIEYLKEDIQKETEQNLAQEAHYSYISNEDRLRMSRMAEELERALKQIEIDYPYNSLEEVIKMADEGTLEKNNRNWLGKHPTGEELTKCFDENYFEYYKENIESEFFKTEDRGKKLLILQENGQLKWIGKQEILVATIIILHKQGYIVNKYFSNKKERLKLRKAFEKYFNVNLQQADKPSDRDKINLPYYKNILPFIIPVSKIQIQKK